MKLARSIALESWSPVSFATGQSRMRRLCTQSVTKALITVDPVPVTSLSKLHIATLAVNRHFHHSDESMIESLD